MLAFLCFRCSKIWLFIEKSVFLQSELLLTKPNLNMKNPMRMGSLQTMVMLLVLYICNIQTISAKTRDTLEPIKQIRITYLSLDGYATYRHVARYMRLNEAFVLKKQDNNKNIPDTINRSCVFDFVHELINDTTDICERINVSQEDFNLFQKIISNKERCLNDYFHIIEEYYTENIKNLNISSFQSLSCQDIIKILDDRANPFYSPVYPMKIELIYENGNKLSVSPTWGYKGLPWSCRIMKKEKVVTYEIVMDFINKIGFDQYVYFKGREEFILQIACALSLM